VSLAHQESTSAGAQQSVSTFDESFQTVNENKVAGIPDSAGTRVVSVASQVVDVELDRCNVLFCLTKISSLNTTLMISTYVARALAVHIKLVVSIWDFVVHSSVQVSGGQGSAVYGVHVLFADPLKILSIIAEARVGY
jgi:hypothetical protein